MSVCPYGLLPSVLPFLLPIPAVISQKVKNKSCLACLKSEKYAL